VLLIRANTDSEDHFKMSFADPASNGKRKFTVPREGELVLGPRGMKMLPLRVPAGDRELIYTTAEVLSQGESNGRLRDLTLPAGLSRVLYTSYPSRMEMV